jgi:hypothetical protein
MSLGICVILQLHSKVAAKILNRGRRSFHRFLPRFQSFTDTIVVLDFELPLHDILPGVGIARHNRDDAPIQFDNRWLIVGFFCNRDLFAQLRNISAAQRVEAAKPESETEYDQPI